MKYPQLVSTRAVNAISDWLVSRLEQLGVEAPQIYTRLLLSLLQSTVQINDPIEFSNLEAFFANRKGGNRRYLPCDTDTLKKLNAVQCLREIVSSEQEIETIEHLVDELCEKLNDIEKQTSEIEDESSLVVLTTVISPSSNNSNNHHDHQHQHHVTNSTNTNTARQNDNRHHQHSVDRGQILSLQQHSVGGGGACGEEQQRAVSNGGTTAIVNTTTTAVDSETDPKKRYFRAFPALSKEMEEDSFRVLRRNAKSLTWPVNRGNINLSKIDSSSSNNSHNSSNSSSSSSSSASLATNSFLFDTSGAGIDGGDDSVVEVAKSIKQQQQQRAIGLGGGVYGGGGSVGVGVGDVDSLGGAINCENVHVTSGSTGVKRKPKRRRNPAFSKGKTIQNTRRGGGSIGGGSGCGGGGGGRNTTPIYWDTDFEGCWEMGPDLIKDFISKQNCRRVNSRNRSTSESAAYSIKEVMAAAEAAATTATATAMSSNKMRMAAAAAAATSQMNDMPTTTAGNQQCDKQEQLVGDGTAVSPPLPLVDISFCCDDEYDDTLASVAELPSDNCLGTTAAPAAAPARRLYQREVSFGSRERLPDVADVAAVATADCVEQADGDDFAQFKAKFNSNVEALWKDAEQPAGDAAGAHASGDGGIYSLPVQGVVSMSASSISAVAPFKEDLRNFWANYYNDHLPQQDKQLEAAAFNQNGVCGSVGSVGGGGCLSYSDTSMRSMLEGVADVVNTSDYFSMPSNLGDVISGGVADAAGNRNSPIGVFFQNSIWSDKSVAGAGDTDESFYLKVWNSSAKALNPSSSSSSGGQHDMQHQQRQQQQQQHHQQQPRVETNGIGGNGSSFHFPPYKASKWSEGINGVPQVKKSGSGDCTDSPSASISVSTTSCSSAAYAQGQVGAVGGVDVGVASSSGGTSLTGAGGAYNWDTPVLLGQNLKADMKSWSASNPLSLTEMYGSLAVVGDDQTDAGGSKRLSGNSFYNAAAAAPADAVGIDVEAEAAAAINDDDDDNDEELSAANVTLPNHCTQTSGFTAYGRIRAAVRAQQQQQQLNYATQFPPRPKERYADDENLLTSERTHFHPIKTYADGHTFDICSALDVIEYERSASGGLYLLADKYLEYTRNDNFLAEEDTANVGASAAPLYASSNCEAAMSAAASRQTLSRQRIKEFVLKFRVQNCEIACQTDDEAEVARRETAAVVAAAKATAVLAATTTSSSCHSDSSDHPLRLLFTGGAVSAKQGSLACSNAIEALNKAVAAAAKATADESKRNCWLTTTSRLDGGVTAASNIWANAAGTIATAIETNGSSGGDGGGGGGGSGGGIDCDEVDFYAGNGNAIERQWAMRDVVGQKCAHNNNSNTSGIDDDDVSSSSNNNNNDIDHLNNNNNNNGDSHGRSIHALWGMCAACNNELKSMPANRLLRDELELEGDEIMSDLKYMQDLYIERAERSSASMDSDSDWGDVEVDLDDGDADCETETETATVDDDIKPFAHGNIGSGVGDGGGGSGGIGVSQIFGDYDVGAHDTQMVLQKVNRLIADLLRPDGGNDDTIGSGCASGDDGNVDVDNCATAGKAFDGANIWGNDYNATAATDKSHNIWQPPTPPPPTTTSTSLMGGRNGDDGIGSDPLELLRQYNLKPPAESALVLCSAKDQKFLSQLSWEHTYLAEIWQKSTPPPLKDKQQQQHENIYNNSGLPMEQANSTTGSDDIEVVEMQQQQQKQQQTNCIDETINANDNSNATGADEHIDDNQSTVIAADDDATGTTMINATTTNDTNSTTTTPASGSEATLRRVQQFLNATVAAVGNNQSTNYNYNLINRNRKRRHSASQNCFHHHHHHHHHHYQQYQPHSRKEYVTNNSPNAYNNNNNNLDVADLNCFNLKLCNDNGGVGGNSIDTDCGDARRGGAALLLDDIAVQKLINNSLRSVLSVRNNNNNNMDDAANAADAAFSLLCGNGVGGGGVGVSTTQPHRQTIITCKYWATIDPAMIASTGGSTAIGNVNGLLANENMCDSVDGGMGALNAELGGALFDKNATILKHVTMATRPLTR